MAWRDPDRPSAQDPPNSQFTYNNSRLDTIYRGMQRAATMPMPDPPTQILREEELIEALSALRQRLSVVICGAPGSGTSTVAAAAARMLLAERLYERVYYIDSRQYSMSLGEIKRKVLLAFGASANEVQPAAGAAPKRTGISTDHGAILVLDNVTNISKTLSDLEAMDLGSPVVVATGEAMSSLDVGDRWKVLELRTLDVRDSLDVLRHLSGAESANANAPLLSNPHIRSPACLRLLAGISAEGADSKTAKISQENPAENLCELAWMVLDPQVARVLRAVLDADLVRWSISDLAAAAAVTEPAAESAIQQLKQAGLLSSAVQQYAVQNSLRDALLRSRSGSDRDVGANLLRSLRLVARNAEIVAGALQNIMKVDTDPEPDLETGADNPIESAVEDEALVASTAWLEREWTSIPRILARSMQVGHWQGIDEAIGPLRACLAGMNRSEDQTYYDQVADRLAQNYSGVQQKLWGIIQKAQQQELDGSLPEAFRSRQEAVALAFSGGRRDQAGDNLVALARLAYRLARVPQAVQYFEHAATEYREGGYSVREADALLALAKVYMTHRFMAEDAFDALQRAYQLYPPNPSRQRNEVLLRLGWLYEDSDDLESAARLYSEAASSSFDVDRQVALSAIESLAGVAPRLGDYSWAVDILKQTIALYQDANDMPGQTRVLQLYADVLLNSGAVGEALEQLRAAYVLAEQSGDEESAAYILWRMGYAMFVLNRPEEIEPAKSAYGQSIFILVNRGDFAPAAAVLVDRATAYLKSGELRQALEDAETALRIYAKINNPSGVARAEYMLGQINLMAENLDAAAEHYERTAAHARRYQDIKFETKVLGELANVYSLMNRHEDAAELRARTNKSAS
jgi:tetratricopeptide (TPR) repeat protein